jgi:hypothetical protein
MTPGSPGTKQYIHYDPERTDYSVSADELSRIESAGESLWKDACLINAIAGTTKPFVLSLALFLNYLVGVLGIVLGVVFAIAWRRRRACLGNIIECIKRKPKMEIVPSTHNVGALPTATLASAGEGGAGPQDVVNRI